LLDGIDDRGMGGQLAPPFRPEVQPVRGRLPRQSSLGLGAVARDFAGREHAQREDETVGVELRPQTCRRAVEGQDRHLFSKDEIPPPSVNRTTISCETDGHQRQINKANESMNQLIAVLLAGLVTARSGAGTITVSMPEGWRQLDANETRLLKPQLKPQNKLQSRLNEPDGAAPIVAMKHDVPGSIAASVQVFLNPIPANMRYATSIELARVIAAVSLSTFRGQYDAEPHETTVGGLDAAEWVAHYTLVETGGSHAMKTRSVIVALRDKYYLVGFSAPATDSEDLEAFEKVVRSIRFSK
jgi:hypothetical protein